MQVVYLTIHNGSYKNTLFYFSYRHLANGRSNLVRLLCFIQKPICRFVVKDKMFPLQTLTIGVRSTTDLVRRCCAVGR